MNEVEFSLQYFEPHVVDRSRMIEGIESLTSWEFIDLKPKTPVLLALLLLVTVRLCRKGAQKKKDPQP